MSDIRIIDLIDLASEDIEDAEEKVQKAFDWYYDKTTMTIKGTIGAAVSIIVALSISYFKQEFKVNLQEIIIAFCFSLATASYGFYKMYELNLITREYISAIKLLSDLKKIRPFLSLYRSILNQ
ncbi:hypothetical protein EOD40_05300 [Flavobacterium sufflavum]|uniref:Uncharacterized protein n=1 Tax=Flavobacterium sufflavum TaxID=1921138 RepID=A0A3S2WGC6_9FLAO|nr:hypothetical protein [Flavobacterium sufflavum]RVT78651.1 hypothetical protein EOD40_05300 [Flavobacterium sufflavum]